jgi:hypothetical protein
MRGSSLKKTKKYNKLRLNKSKKHTKKSNLRKKHYHNKSRKNKTLKFRKGGDLVNKTNSFLPSINKVDCSKMDIDIIEDPKTLHSRYQVCCPKQFGFKNRSPICKKMDDKFKNILNQQNQSIGTYGYDDNTELEDN